MPRWNYGATNAEDAEHAAACSLASERAATACRYIIRTVHTLLRCFLSPLSSPLRRSPRSLKRASSLLCSAAHGDPADRTTCLLEQWRSGRMHLRLVRGEFSGFLGEDGERRVLSLMFLVRGLSFNFTAGFRPESLRDSPAGLRLNERHQEHSVLAAATAAPGQPPCQQLTLSLSVCLGIIGFSIMVVNF